MHHASRKRRFVDREVQGRLIAAALRYWGLSVFLVATLSLLGWMFIYPGIGGLIATTGALSCLPMLGISALVAVLLAPFALYDLLRLSHLFAGPMVRLRQHMATLAAGGDPGALRFRDADFWHDLAEHYNEVRQHVLQLRQAAATTPSSRLNEHEAYLVPSRPAASSPLNEYAHS